MDRSLLLAEELLLVLLDGATGQPKVDGTKLDHALAGALLLELALAGRVDVTRREGLFSSDRIAITDHSLLGHPLLDEALTKVAAKEGQKPQNMLGPLTKGLRPALLQSLGERGIVHATEHRVLGLFRTTRWLAADSQPGSRLLANLRSVLLYDTAPDERSAALISLLSAIDVVPKIVGPDDPRADQKLLRERAKQIAGRSWASGAVKKAVEAVNAATTAAVVAATSGAIISGGS